MKRKLLKKLALIALMVMPNIVYADTFWVSGQVTRSLTETTEFGKCMVQLNVDIGNGCTSNWVSLDCQGKYIAPGDGDRMFNIVLLAQNLNKTVSIRVDSTKAYNGFCVATRLDLLK